MSVDGLLFTLTLYTQGSLGYSAIPLCAVTALMTASSVGAAYVAEQLIARVGTAVVARAGLVLLSVTCLTFAVVVVTGGSWPLLSAGMLVFGAAMGCAYTAGSIESLTGVSERESGTASAVQAISFTLGATLGVALLSTVATSVGPNIAQRPWIHRRAAGGLRRRSGACHHGPGRRHARASAPPDAGPRSAAGTTAGRRFAGPLITGEPR